jgi:hypothetical protein
MKYKKIVPDNTKVIIKNDKYTAGMTGTIGESRLFGSKGTKVVYYINMDTPFYVPYRTEAMLSVMLERQDFDIFQNTLN